MFKRRTDVQLIEIMIFKKILKNKIFILFFILFAIFILKFRYDLDKDNIFVASDGQIKFYQTFQIKSSHLFNINCYYPNGQLDTNFKFYPIRYPWTIIDTKTRKCVYEYPPFFPALITLLSWNKNYKLIMYIPLCFYLLSFIFFYLILDRISKEKILNSLICLLIFYSFPLLTSMDFSESPIYHFSVIIAIYLFIYSKQNILFRNFIFGLFIGISIFFRMEILIPSTLLSLAFFVIQNHWHDRIKNSFSFGIGFLITISIFFYYNYTTSHHIFGYRYISSLLENRIISPSINFKLNLLGSYLFGDKVMVGIFKFHPMLLVIFLLSIYQMFKNKLKEIEFIFIFAGFLSLILIPLSINFYGGVGYFGLRYLETPFFFIAIGMGLYINRIFTFLPSIWKYTIYFILVFSIYWTHLSTKEGLKVLKNSSKDFTLLQNIINDEKNIIIHTSLYTSIFIGPSLLESSHFHIPTDEEIKDFIKLLPQNKYNLILLLPPKDMYISPDIPVSLIKNYRTDIHPEKLNLSIQDTYILNGIKIIKAKILN